MSLINYCVLLQTTESTEGEKPGSQDQEILQPVPVPAATGSEVDSEEVQTTEATEQPGEQPILSEGQPIRDKSPTQNNDG